MCKIDIYDLSTYPTKELLYLLHECRISGKCAIIGDWGELGAIYRSKSQVREELAKREHIFNKKEGERLRRLMSKFKMKKDKILEILKFRNYVFLGIPYE